MNHNPKILNFHEQDSNNENKSPNLPDFHSSNLTSKKIQRLPQHPFKVLPANYLRDDFYLNLLDYSESGHIGVGLQSGLFIWSGCATRVTKAH